MNARLLRRWRENYYVSRVLSLGAKPVHSITSRLAKEIEKKVRTNGSAIRLPNGRTLNIARDSGINMASLLFWQGLEGYEPHTWKTLRFFFERCSTFVDVGANYGYYSLLAALWNSELKVISFEPVPQIYRGLVRNVAANHLENRVTTYEIALSDSTGKAVLFLPNTESSNLESTGTLVTDSWQSKKDPQTFEVQTMRFDDFEDAHPQKLVIAKIDVEDFESAVLRGMKRTIRRDRPFLVCEILPRAHKNRETQELIANLGYTAYWITRCGAYIQVSGFDFPRNACDFLLSPVAGKSQVIGDLTELWNLK